MTVHSSKCKTLATADPERRIDVEWDVDEEKTYPVSIQIVTQDRPGVLADLTGVIAAEKVNITKANVETTPESKGVASFTIQVAGKEHLRRVLVNLKKIKWVERVVRLGS